MKMFLLTWYVENYSFCWQKKEQSLAEAVFLADEFGETRWSLKLFPNGMSKEEDISFVLSREADNGPEAITINGELSLFDFDGSLLKSWQISRSGQSTFIKDLRKECHFSYVRDPNFEVKFLKRNVHLPKDTLKVQFRMWRDCEPYAYHTTEIFVRTRIGVERISFVGKADLKTIKPQHKNKIYINLSEIRSLMTMNLYFRPPVRIDLWVAISPNAPEKQIKFLSLKLSLLTATGEAIDCGQEDACFHENQTRQLILYLPITEKELMERKKEYFPTDCLSLQCDVAFTTGIEIHKVEQTVCDRHLMPKSKPVAEDESKCQSSVHLHDLGSACGDLRSLYNNQIMSDIKMNAKTESFPAHKTVLCARSPVIRAMFVNDMKEKTGDCIEVPDLEDDTMRRFLLFLYTDSVEDLQWDIATKLYYAADKYQVQRLKEVCSSFLTDNLNTSNVSELLVLADMHQDADLKDVVEEFILQHEEEVFRSNMWEKFMEANPQLALVTMHSKYKRKATI